MSLYPYVFDAEIVHHYLGTMRYTVVFLAADLARQPPFSMQPRLRATGEVAEVPFSGAWQPVGARRYLMLSKQLLKDAGKVVGDHVEVRFRLRDDTAVDVPPELLRALRAHPQADARWRALRPGQQRGFAHRVASAKTEATRIKRLREVLAALAGS